jgi:hypothetical protein
MKKRDRRQTPYSTSLAVGKPGRQSSIYDMFNDTVLDAVSESTELKTDTASAIFLKGEGTSKDTAKVIPKEISKINKNKYKKDKRNDYRVPVLNPDGIPAMPTTSRRANKWLKEGKAKIVNNKLGIFHIQLLKEPSGRNKQDIVLTVKFLEDILNCPRC